MLFDGCVLLSGVDFEVMRCRPLKKVGLFSSGILLLLSLGPSPGGTDLV